MWDSAGRGAALAPSQCRAAGTSRGAGEGGLCGVVETSALWEARMPPASRIGEGLPKEPNLRVWGVSALFVQLNPICSLFSPGQGCCGGNRVFSF